MPLFSRARQDRPAAPAEEAAASITSTGTAADGAVEGQVVSPARAPELPDRWTYRFTSRGMGDARIDLVDHRGRVVASQPFVGHAQSPDFVLSPACAQVHAAWQAAGGTVFEVRNFTASASAEGAGWRVWCNQALGVTFLVDDLDDAPAAMVQALAEAKGLDPAEVRVTMVSSW